MNTILSAIKAFAVTLGIPVLAMFLCLALFFLMLSAGLVVLGVAFGPLVGASWPIQYGEAAGWLGGLLALTNLLLISSPAFPTQLKRANFVRWAFYAVPSCLILSGLGYRILFYVDVPVAFMALHVVWASFIISVPFVSAAHFIHLLHIRRKLRGRFDWFRELAASLRSTLNSDTSVSCVRCGGALATSVPICPVCGWTQPA